jgi:hypothetical protein
MNNESTDNEENDSQILESEMLELNELKVGLANMERKHSIKWIIRWSITIYLYVTFWEYEWVRWTLVLTIPLGLASLYMTLFGANKIFNKIEKLENRINNIK